MNNFLECYGCNCQIPLQLCMECNVKSNKNKRAIYELRRRLLQLREENAKQAAEADDLLTQQWGIRKKQAVKETIQIRINNLLNQVSLGMDSIAQAKAELQTTTLQLKKDVNTYNKCSQFIVKQTERINKQFPPSLAHKRGQLRLLENDLQFLRREKVNRLRTILEFFPFDGNPEEEMWIVRPTYRLPNNGDFSRIPEYVLAAVLGYIAQLVHYISVYLDVPLPYSFVLCGSRSSVYRATDPDKKYPLYNTGTIQFLQGLSCLNQNISYLCFIHSISIENEAQTLPNLFHLVNHSSFGRIERATSLLEVEPVAKLEGSLSSSSVSDSLLGSVSSEKPSIIIRRVNPLELKEKQKQPQLEQPSSSSHSSLVENSDLIGSSATDSLIFPETYAEAPMLSLKTINSNLLYHVSRTQSEANLSKDSGQSVPDTSDDMNAYTLSEHESGRDNGTRNVDRYEDQFNESGEFSSPNVSLNPEELDEWEML